MSITAKKDLNKKKQILEQEYGIKMTREMEGDAAYMSGISTYFIEQGIELGVERGIEQGIDQGARQTKGECAYRLMESLTCTFEKAMEILRIPKEEWEECHAIVESLQNANCDITT